MNKYRSKKNHLTTHLFIIHLNAVSNSKKREIQIVFSFKMLKALIFSLSRLIWKRTKVSSPTGKLDPRELGSDYCVYWAHQKLGLRLLGRSTIGPKKVIFLIWVLSGKLYVNTFAFDSASKLHTAASIQLNRRCAYFLRCYGITRWNGFSYSHIRKSVRWAKKK